MKICWTNIENMFLSENGNFRKGNVVYVERDACKHCGLSYLGEKRRHTEFCSRSCAAACREFSPESKSKMAASASKGNVVKFNLPLYNTYSKQLNYADEVRPYYDKLGRKLLEAKCSKCNTWFRPNRTDVMRRVRALNGKTSGEQRLYCSQECKDSCEVFGKQAKSYIDLTPKEFPYIQEELRVWSKEVLKRANHRCEICGKKAEHAHHIQPKKLEPGLALDPENGLAICKKCHYKYGHKESCSTGALANKLC